MTQAVPEEYRQLAEENNRLRRAMANSGLLPETEVELAKDLFTPEIKGGKYGDYIAKNLGLGNYTAQEAKVMLIYQSLIDTAVNECLDDNNTNLAGFFESKKMAFAAIATASKAGFLLTNLRTSRGINEVTSQDLTPQQKNQQNSMGNRLRPQNPQQGYY